MEDNKNYYHGTSSTCVVRDLFSRRCVLLTPYKELKRRPQYYEPLVPKNSLPTAAVGRRRGEDGLLPPW